MRRNKMGASIIVAQTAITLAILCNSIFIIQQRLKLSERPSGTLEADIFTIANQWVGRPSDLASRARADLAALRAVPGVVDAYVSNSFPSRTAVRTMASASSPPTITGSRRVRCILR